MANGNKGKFSDRLKRMKLYRAAKHKKMIIKNGKLTFDSNVRYINKSIVKVNNSILSNNIVIDDENVVNKVKTGLGVGVALGGAVISNLIDVDDKVNQQDKNDIIFEDFKFDNEGNKVVKNEKKEELFVKDKINNGIKTGLGIGVALGGAVISNLIDDKKNDNFNDSSFNNKTSNIKLNSSNSTGNNTEVYKVGKDYIDISNVSHDDIKNGDKKTYLAIQIMKKIKKEYDKKLNEIDVLESELFLLNEKNKTEKDLEKCKEIRKKINEIIDKINHIIEQYNIYKSHNFELDMLDIDDKSLVDDISDFKILYNGADIKRRLVSDYELIKEYQDLYSNLNDIKYQVEEVSKNNNDKIDLLYSRDKKIDSLGKSVVDIDKVNKDITSFISAQDEYLNDIKNKVGNIDISSITKYKLRGFGEILASSVKYVGLLSLSPLTGMFPSIALNIMASKYMVHNLYNALTLDKVTTTIYKAKDFQNDISKKLYDLDFNSYVLKDSKRIIKDIKINFLEYFNYDDSSHVDMLRRINILENNLDNQEYKLNLIKDRLLKNKIINEKTINKVKILEKDSEK